MAKAKRPKPGPKSAEVTTLTATVTALVVGSRQVTLSVFRQLDTCRWDQIIPFGRVRDKQSELGYRHGVILLVGKRIADGALVRSWVYPESSPPKEAPYADYWDEEQRAKEAEKRQTDLRYYEFSQSAQQLPLIVLAGLR